MEEEVQQPTPAQAEPEATPEEPPRPLEDILRDLDRHHATDKDTVNAALRKHQVVTGLAGEIAQAKAGILAQEREREAAAKAAQAKHEELMRMAEEDPEAFATQFRTEAQAKRAQQELEQLRLGERRALAEQIGRANSALPEWSELSPTEQSTIAKRLQGVPADQVFAVYQAAVVDVVAEKRAAKRVESSLAERLKAEKAAWEEEQAAKRVKQTPAPSLRSGRAPGTDSDEPDYYADRRAWDAWYEKKRGLRKVGT